jgi:hypothetical protein
MTDTTSAAVAAPCCPLTVRIDAWMRGGDASNESAYNLLQDARTELAQLRFAASCAIAAKGGEVSATTASLITQLRQRDRAGLAKYGTTLDRTDLTPFEWMQHAVEEMLDAAGYLVALQRTLASAQTASREAAREGGDPGSDWERKYHEANFSWVQILEAAQKVAPEEFSSKVRGTNMDRVLRVIQRAAKERS